ncbi:MAG: tetratricopeptide repeat protein [Candidatus Rokuibacteriota bacterium]
MIATVVAALLIGVPAFAFALWPLLSRSRVRALLPLPPDAREQLLERKRQVFRGLRELDFEHESGHISDEDYHDLRARAEAEASETLTELDRLGPVATPAVSTPREAMAPTSRGWRHPAAIVSGAVALLVFGIALGAGVVRHTAPDPSASVPAVGSRPLAPPFPAGGGESPAAEGGGGSTRAISPQMLQGMLQAARGSLFEGRYGEAIAAYQAVLKRNPKNVDAMTHLGLIVALGGHVDQALETLDRALAIDPNYPPALLYRGQILLESKQDAQGAIKSWEKFVAVVPPGEDRDRVSKLLDQAKTRR